MGCCLLTQIGSLGEKPVETWLFDHVMLYAKALVGTGKFQLLRWLDLVKCEVSAASGVLKAWGEGSRPYEGQIGHLREACQ